MIKKLDTLDAFSTIRLLLMKKVGDLEILFTFCFSYYLESWLHDVSLSPLPPPLPFSPRKPQQQPPPLPLLQLVPSLQTAQ
ncbi:hypothetical protein AYI68_g2409 [Smittium mucronatum]|uniref:Uncharacterized protein n=1 Tax=Smittium mucronatum TaxID=133383 RepID=A0A1R0H2V4_9FUNG|nr:hypothetical protein AYI68_g2409 [Smittium mucronatum]